jgi:hypothetical protein
VSLDKDAISDPNLEAVHAGASMRKAQHLQAAAKSFGYRRCRGGLFCLFQTRCPHSSTLQVGGKAHFASKTISLFFIARFILVYSVRKQYKTISNHRVPFGQFSLVASDLTCTSRVLALALIPTAVQCPRSFAHNLRCQCPTCPWSGTGRSDSGPVRSGA